ncbi:MAG: zf-HC2 domain-containing protein, partial [Planctomycetes bacterium]|nr:zf-HC2 domain-containing protein [Planctomycetota bacterium]
MMAKRDKNQDDLSAYLDGELGEADAKRVEEALSHDPALARRLDQIRTLREMVLSMPPHKAPDNLIETIVQRAERNSLMGPTAPAQRGTKLRWLGYGLAAAVLVLAACLTATVMHDLWAPEESPVTIARHDQAGR